MLHILIEVVLTCIGFCGDRVFFWCARHAWYFYKSERLVRQLGHASRAEELWELSRIVESFRSERPAIIILLQHYESFESVQDSAELRFYDEQERVQRLSEETFDTAVALLKRVHEHPCLRSHLPDLAERLPKVWEQWYQRSLPPDALDCLYETERLLESARAERMC